MNLRVDTSSVPVLELTRAQYQIMLDHVRNQAPEEACGLLGGQRLGELARVAVVIPVTNALHSPTRYRMDPQEQLAAFNRLDAEGWELLAIYHSHPQGPPTLSHTDLAEAFYPEAVYLIWSTTAGDWECRGYLLREGNVQSIALKIKD